jgi:hypothetical protein
MVGITRMSVTEVRGEDDRFGDGYLLRIKRRVVDTEKGRNIKAS